MAADGGAGDRRRRRVGTAWLAWSTDDGVVADDYYKRGLVINKQLERSHRGEALGLGAMLASRADGAVRVVLSGLADRRRCRRPCG